jgi:hypothetical protein
MDVPRRAASEMKTAMRPGERIAAKITAPYETARYFRNAG